MEQCQAKETGKTRANTSATGESGLQGKELTTNECAVCIGACEEDLKPNGMLVHEWVQCPNTGCAKWMHEDCVEAGDDPESETPVLKCHLCGTVFH